jgi:hypothetical protein
LTGKNSFTVEKNDIFKIITPGKNIKILKKKKKKKKKGKTFY